MTNLLKRGLLRSRRNTTLPFTIKEITSDVPTPKEKQVLLPRGTFFERTVRINGKVHKYLYRKLSASEKESHAATLRERHIAIGPKPTKLETHRSVEPPTRPLVQSVPPTRVELNETKSLSPRLHSKPLDSAPSTKAIIHAQDPKKESNLPPGAFERHLTVNGQTVTFVDRPAIPAEERAHTREILVRVGATQPRLAHRFTQKRVRNALKVNPHKDQLVVELKERIPTPPPEDCDNFAFGFVTGFASLICILMVFG